MLPGLILLLGAAIALVSPLPPPPARAASAVKGESPAKSEPPVKSEPPAKSESPVDEHLKQRIDQWIARNGLNQYGDPPGTMYLGGSPLFDENTGIRKDRYQYILDKHPELKDDGSRIR